VTAALSDPKKDDKKRYSGLGRIILVLCDSVGKSEESVWDCVKRNNEEKIKNIKKKPVDRKKKNWGGLSILGSLDWM
jgi:hypothetical protein